MAVKKYFSDEERKEGLRLSGERYREKNREQYNVKRKAYYEKNREKIAIRQKAHYSTVKEKQSENSRRWYSSPENQIRRRQSRYKTDFNTLKLIQKNRCGICNVEFPSDPQATIDHDHDTGLVRGLLCRKCNSGIGMLQENWELLEKASQWVFNGKVRFLNGS